jgi:hypothetical protein
VTGFDGQQRLDLQREPPAPLADAAVLAGSPVEPPRPHVSELAHRRPLGVRLADPAQLVLDRLLRPPGPVGEPRRLRLAVTPNRRCQWARPPCRYTAARAEVSPTARNSPLVGHRPRASMSGEMAAVIAASVQSRPSRSPTIQRREFVPRRRVGPGSRDEVVVRRPGCAPAKESAESAAN